MGEEGELPLVRRSGKSDSAFRTISEVADELDVPQHVLRFWESKFPQVKPLKRGGGRRYYRPEDVALLRRIRDLLYSEGYTIKGVQKLLREGAHKEPAGTSSDAEPTLPLRDDNDGVAFPEGGESDEGEGPAETDDESVPAAGRRFSAEERAELQEILAELERLRGLLQPR
jgi:Predicted transcriptional regulators